MVGQLHVHHPVPLHPAQLDHRGGRDHIQHHLLGRTALHPRTSGDELRTYYRLDGDLRLRRHRGVRVAGDRGRQDSLGACLTQGANHVGSRTRGGYPHQGIVRIDMILLKFLPSLIQIVFRRLHWIPERPVTAGDQTDHQGIRHTVRGRDLGGVQDTQATTRTRPDIEEPAASPHPLYDTGYQLLDLRDLPANGDRHFPVLVIDAFQQLPDRHLIQIIVQRFRLGYLLKCHNSFIFFFVRKMIPDQSVHGSLYDRTDLQV